MKKIVLTLAVSFIAISVIAQNMDGIIAQPTHVIGRRINAEGEITKEYTSDFSYFEDGKLQSYEFPEYAISASYCYSGNFISQEYIAHQAGHPVFNEYNYYTYENGEIKTISHIMDNMGTSQYWVYSYYDDGRLERKDYREEDDDDFRIHWLYDYEDEGKTVVESYYTSWVSQGMLLRKKTTSQYDESFKLLSTITENYNTSGELTSSSRCLYSYASNGSLETKNTQTLSEGEWVNSSIVQYSYDDNGIIIEQLEGTWSTEIGEWDFTRKITFMTSEDGQTYIVSFYKKSQGVWVWDVFNNQTVLFGSNLKAQQRALSYMVYESMNGHGNVNQLEFSMEEMNEPIYLDTEEHSSTIVALCPNPTTGIVRVEGENASEVQVFNALGQLVKTVQNANEVSLEGLPQGVYLLRVTLEGGKVFSDKVVKE